MPEDAGKKRYIKDFLQQVQLGDGFVEDIWIERVVRPPGSEGEGSTARSLSGRQISNITQLLEDDLRHTFDEGYFIFRFVAASLGSGKTSLLAYLHELTKTKPTYKNHAVVVQFSLSDLLTVSVNQSFSIKLYCHILAQTFWELIHNKNLSSLIKTVSEDILSSFLESPQVAQLKSATSLMAFRAKFNDYFAISKVGFEELFFHVISQISAKDPRFAFVYLIDELDALQEFPNEVQETRALFKALIKRVSQQFGSRIHLLVYLVGTSDNVGGFIARDPVLESLVWNSIINLNKGYSNEIGMIKTKIDERIQGAYKGYKTFTNAWQAIQNISLSPANNLRKFCQEYAGVLLKIHVKHFEELPEQKFEGDARQLVKAQCGQQWSSYLSKAAYTLSATSTTTVEAGHAFDCYVELLHNGTCVARAFGEAKNYELLSSHLKTFKQWLDDVGFNPFTSGGGPPDLAFMIAPSCPPLLQRKLELKNIQFIEANIVTETTVNVNTANKVALISAFRGTGIKQKTVDNLMSLRKNKWYIDLYGMEADGLISTVKVREKLQRKLDNGEICFK